MRTFTVDVGDERRVFARRHICRKLGSVSWLERSRMFCVLLLGLNGPWEEVVAALLVGSVVGIANVSAKVNIYV